MRGFFEELRHRNVFRVAIAYVVAGWLLAQVADLIVDAFNLPDSFLQMIIVLLLLGFPIAVIFAWAFELTPDGLKRAHEVPIDAPKDPRSGRFLNRLTIVALVFAVAWLGWDKLQRSDSVDTPVAATAASDMSIAVLPFADFSPDADHAWFADGLTDEILNALARTRSLRVASRTSAFAYKDTEKDARTIAGELGVAHILEGSVRRAGDRIRVTAQLIRTSDDAHLWSQTFDATSDDSIEIQEAIAFEIATVLDTALDSEELRKMVAAGTESIEAWETFVRWQGLWNTSNENFETQSANEKMLELYAETIRHDPGFGEAHLLLAEIAYGWLDSGSILRGPDGMTSAEMRAMFVEAAENAARHAQHEETRIGAQILWARAESRIVDEIELTRALVELSANDQSHWVGHLGALLNASRFEEAAAFAERALRHDFGQEAYNSDFLAIIARVNLDPALQATREVLLRPDLAPAHFYQAHRIFLYANLVTEAAALGRRYKEVANDETWTLMINIRQACAEGRNADAQRYYDDYDFSKFDIANTNIQWLALQTLGHTEQAIELLRPLDRPEMFVALTSLLGYTHFDPRPYPNLTAHLESQGVMRDEPLPLNFACKR